MPGQSKGPLPDASGRQLIRKLGKGGNKDACSIFQKGWECKRQRTKGLVGGGKGTWGEALEGKN